MGIRFTKRQIIGIAMIAVSVGAYLLLDHISVSPSPSLDYRVFWRSTAAKYKAGLAKGDYVTFDARNPDGSGTIREGKMVGCAPGDRLVVNNMNDSYCNGRYLGHAKPISSKGTPVTAFQFDGVVPKDHFYMVGTHRDSWDSKYYGFVTRDRILEVAWPLL